MKFVAPYVGAWIEMASQWGVIAPQGVAPYVGAWIEIYFCFIYILPLTLSHPMWVRGLKWNLGKKL